MYLYIMCRNIEWIMYVVMVCFSLVIDDCEDIVFILCIVVNIICYYYLCNKDVMFVVGD